MRRIESDDELLAPPKVKEPIKYEPALYYEIRSEKGQVVGEQFLDPIEANKKARSLGFRTIVVKITTSMKEVHMSYQGPDGWTGPPRRGPKPNWMVRQG